MSKNLTVVVKTSKLCNLRCKYCYELSQLGDNKKISERNIELMFKKILLIEEETGTTAKFCWHGGEPLLLGSAYFKKVFDIQKAIFSSKRINVVQTNLYRLSENDIETIKLFDQVSISYDVFSNDRVNLAGSPTGDKVISNMDKLRNLGLSFGAINVISSKNIKKIDKIIDFYNKSAITLRILPYYREDNKSQTEKFGISSSEISTMMIRCIDKWMTESLGTLILPIHDFLTIAAREISGKGSYYKYDKSKKEHVLLVNTDGKLYSAGTAYNDRYCYGNIFEDTASKILSSEGRKAAIDRAASLQADSCRSCQYFGSCSGYAIAEQTDIELKENGGACKVWKPAINRAKDWIKEVGDLSLKMGASNEKII